VRAIDPVLTSLLCGRPCVAFRTRVSSSPVHNNPVDMPAKTDAETVAVARFAIDRGAAGLAIDGDHALLDVEDLFLPRDNDAREEHVRLLHGLTGMRTTRFHEAIIEVGATVSVVGVVMFDLQAELSAGEHGFRDELKPRERLVGDFDHPLLISQAD